MSAHCFAAASLSAARLPAASLPSSRRHITGAAFRSLAGRPIPQHGPAKTYRRRATAAPVAADMLSSLKRALGQVCTRMLLLIHIAVEPTKVTQAEDFPCRITPTHASACCRPRVALARL